MGSERESRMVEGPVESVSREEVVKVIREMKAGKTVGPSDEMQFGFMPGKGYKRGKISVLGCTIV